MSGWHDVGHQMPGGSKKQLERGIPVLIWPHYEDGGTSPTPFAYYGTRYGCGKIPVFYIYGRQIWPTHWRKLPKGPADQQNEGRS